ncbi:Chalcone-flavanone isomerase [Planctomycetes bacterium Pan216]|uniref:Chalcone-flavanone isomerase n=1 Tax=Kolteria novifilia TaxID=2527975 RepID=A0A518B5H5_9BACT|nr:Chalcone-flavanone isomerase [Planctomycetes bacterium Pan216]
MLEHIVKLRVAAPLGLLFVATACGSSSSGPEPWKAALAEGRVVKLGQGIPPQVSKKASPTAPDPARKVVALSVPAAEEAHQEVPGCQIRFPQAIESGSGEVATIFDLTGAALRKRLWFNVYAMGSYVARGTDVHNAQDLVDADIPKRLLLVMDRKVSSSQMASSVRGSLERQPGARKLQKDIDKLIEFLRTRSIDRGDEIWLIHTPGVGFTCRFNDEASMEIPDPEFSQLVWNSYFGPAKVSDDLCSGLTSRL